MPVMAVAEPSAESRRLSFSFRERFSACREAFSSAAADNCGERRRESRPCESGTAGRSNGAPGEATERWEKWG